ncbi:MAG: VTT domain-containing protein [Balneolaceae bacterium]
MIETGKKIVYTVWLLSIAAVFLTYLIYPGLFTAKSLVHVLETFQTELLVVYILVTFIRGFFMIPSTPFVLGGAILFPDMLLLVLIISMAGVLFSATCIYYFSDILGFSGYLESKYPDAVAVWQERLQHPRAFAIVTGWAFFPLVPTDLICYAGGIIKMPVRFVLGGVFIGELTLNIFYVYAGSSIFTLLIG